MDLKKATGVEGGKKSTDWTEWLGIAALWYVPIGIIILLAHKDESISPLGWFGIYLASPVIIVGGAAVLFAAILAVWLPMVWLWRRLNGIAHWNRYEDFLQKIQNKSMNAKREGRKWEARWLKVAYWIVAIPIVILIYLIAGGAAARYE